MKKLLFLFSLLILMLPLAIKAQVTLVKDINPGADNSLNQFPRTPCGCLNDLYFFHADDGIHGQELWISDGTENGTFMLNDINPGDASTTISQPFLVDDIIYFTANTPGFGVEPWRSDGTIEGTYLLKDVNPGTASSFANDFVAFNGKVYFPASSEEYGREFWLTDGTEAGTELAFELVPGSDNSGPVHVNVFQDQLYFWSNHEFSSGRFYRSDGTVDNTIAIASIKPGQNQVDIPAIFIHNDLMYFAADSDETDTEPWRSDGTAEGTFLLKDIDLANPNTPWTGSSYPRSFHSFQGNVYFGANNAFWRTDGTTTGTQKIGDMNLSPTISIPYRHIASNDNHMFFFGDMNTDDHLWRSDGTIAGTVIADEGVSAFFGLEPTDFVEKNNIIYFLADTKDYGREVAFTLGELSDLQVVADIQAGEEDSNPFCLRICGDRLFFYADDGTHGNELFTSDVLTSTKEIHQNERLGLQAQPNPINHELSIQLDPIFNGKDIHYQIINSIGQSIRSGQETTTHFMLNTTDLKTGIYFIQVVVEEEYGILKVVKQ